LTFKESTSGLLDQRLQPGVSGTLLYEQLGRSGQRSNFPVHGFPQFSQGKLAGFPHEHRCQCSRFGKRPYFSRGLQLFFGDSVNSAYRGKYLGQGVSATPSLIRFRKYLFGKCIITEDAAFLVSTGEFASSCFF
jgi:hypothetical protein